MDHNSHGSSQSSANVQPNTLLEPHAQLTQAPPMLPAVLEQIPGAYLILDRLLVII
jgi:hypothetical protein